MNMFKFKRIFINFVNENFEPKEQTGNNVQQYLLLYHNNKIRQVQNL